MIRPVKNRPLRLSLFLAVAFMVTSATVFAQDTGDTAKKPSSYAPVKITEGFASTMTRMKAEKAGIMQRQMDLLNERYDLSNRPAQGVAMSRGKAVQEGVRIKLLKEMTWEKLAAMSSEEIREKDLLPSGFFPLPFPNHPEGGMLFPKFQIDEINRQESRDLTRFDLDYDLPDHFLPEFPAPIYLTTRADLGDVSQGKVVTIMNYFELFNGILNPKQLEGLRLLVTPFPQQQFNQTEDRRTEKPSRGVTCFDCHVNGHTNAATHLVGDIRPQEFRHRLDTPTLRGVNIQRLFGSQRALKSVEDFTEFEQRAAYFDGDHVIAAKKGINILDRGHQVHSMAEFQAILDFPPAPKLGIDGKLDVKKASESEKRGQDLFFGKGNCGSCHPAPYYTDNLMHNMKTERFYKPRMINGRMASADGPIKTFPLRGIKDSPPYLHDERLLTLEDTVEFFNLILQTGLNEQEKKDLVAFMRALQRYRTSYHMDYGIKQFGLPWMGVSQAYPQYRGREDKVAGLEERINGCFERSLNGKAIALDSREMKAMVAYVNWQSKITAAFKHRNMPLGTEWNHPAITNEDSYDVAAYLNLKERPQMSGLEKDYPKMEKEAVDCPYPPYADDFAYEQYQSGPFQPIMTAQKK